MQNNKRKYIFISNNNNNNDNVNYSNSTKPYNKSSLHENNIVKLNVGGIEYMCDITIFQRYPETYLGVMFSSRNADLLKKNQSDQSIFIARDGKLFRYILNFYLNNQIVYPWNDSAECTMLDKEYKFFGLYDNFWNLKTFDGRFEAQCKIKNPKAVELFKDILEFVKCKMFSISFYRFHIEIINDSGWIFILGRDFFKKYQLKNFKKNHLFIYDCLKFNEPCLALKHLNRAQNIEIKTKDHCDIFLNSNYYYGKITNKPYSKYEKRLSQDSPQLRSHFSLQDSPQLRSQFSTQDFPQLRSHFSTQWKDDTLHYPNIYVIDKDFLKKYVKLLIFFREDFVESFHGNIVSILKPEHIDKLDNIKFDSHIYNRVNDVDKNEFLFCKDYDNSSGSSKDQSAYKSTQWNTNDQNKKTLENLTNEQENNIFDLSKNTNQSIKQSLEILLCDKNSLINLIDRYECHVFALHYKNKCLNFLFHFQVEQGLSFKIIHSIVNLPEFL